MKIAVIYYSKSGVTEKIVKKIQEKCNVDLYFVEPDKSYGGYLSSVASVAKEKLTKNPAKPKTKPADFSMYDLIFIGFPVWYSTMPLFLQTYIKESNIMNQHVIPFATAGANGKDRSLATVKELFPECNITDYFYTSNLKKANADQWLKDISDVIS